MIGLRLRLALEERPTAARHGRESGGHDGALSGPRGAALKGSRTSGWGRWWVCQGELDGWAVTAGGRQLRSCANESRSPQHAQRSLRSRNDRGGLGVQRAVHVRGDIGVHQGLLKGFCGVRSNGHVWNNRRPSLGQKPAGQRRSGPMGEYGKAGPRRAGIYCVSLDRRPGANGAVWKFAERRSRGRMCTFGNTRPDR